MKSVAILGSTGSVGSQTLDIIEKYPERFNVKLLAASKPSKKLINQINKFKPEYVYVENFSDKVSIDGVKVLTGKEGIDFYSKLNIDIYVNGIAGISGIYPTYVLLKNKKNLATANKEAIICLGEICGKEYDRIIPIDSEHSSIFQTLNCLNKKDVFKIILTSSGGPFFYTPIQDFRNITVQQALNHPKWKMGKKISIDSATLMNKGLEVIEAYYLFKVDYSQIDVVIHPQSVVHSIVELVDGNLFANLSPTDMRYPISYALFYPSRIDIDLPRLNLVDLNKLEFYEPDTDKFPLLKIAIEAGKKGDFYPIVLTVADEIVVNKFLNKEIKFVQIPIYIERILEKASFDKPESIEDVFRIIDETKKIAEEVIG